MHQPKNKYPGAFFLAICLLFLNGFPASSEQIIIDSSGQFDFARTCMKRGEYEMAVAEFERFIHFFPEAPRVSKARCMIGICYLKDRHFDKARETFLRIIGSESDPHLVGRALLLTGESYYRQGIWSEAAYYYRQVIEKCPCLDLKNMAHYRLGWTRMQAGSWQDASKTFSQVKKDSLFYESSRRLAEQSLKGEALKLKKPVYAGAMAALVPGAGHAYVSRYRDAAVAFVLNGLFIWAAVESFNHDQEVLGGILSALETGWYTGNIYSAINCVHKYNRRVQDNFRKSLKDQFDLNLFAADKGCAGFVLTFRF